jgi:RND family efflux transporter MFP subunit
MALWKQVLIILALMVATVVGWGAFDPTARDRLTALGLPDWSVPQWAFIANADGATGPDAAKPGEGRRNGGAGGPGAGGPGSGGPGGFGGPISVVTAPVFSAETNDRVTAIGTGEAAKTVTLFPRSTGMVAAVNFEPGQRVEAGSVLVALDDDVEKLALERAQVTLRDARAKVTRAAALFTNRSISAVERDLAVSELASAEVGAREAQLALDRRRILAPFAGIVGLTDVEPGKMVSATSEIATVDDRSALKLEFRIPEAFAAKVAVGQSVDAKTPSRPGQSFTGVVSAVGSRIEEDSRTLVVQARLDNAADELRPGMSFQVSLRFTGDIKTAVPALSVQWDRDGSYVWRVVAEKVERVPVVIAERNADTVLIEGELTPGDTVVVEGVQRLRPGAAVALADAPVDAAPLAPTDPAAAARRS